LEHYAKLLQEQYATIKQANAELANEAKQKNEIALERDGLKQALDQARKSGNGGNDIETMQKKVYDLEQFSQQLQEQYESVKQANADLANEARDKFEIVQERDRMIQALNEAKDTGQGDVYQLKTMQNKIKKMEQHNRQLQDLNESVKQANADLTIESKQKLEIALEEVRKANATEKALNLEKLNYLKELENSTQIIESMNKQLAELRSKNASQDEKIKELEEKAKTGLDESETTKTLKEKHQGLYRAYQSRLAEISQLKIVIDRIGRENTMWSKEIQELRGKNGCQNPEHAIRDSNFVKIREAYLDNNNIDEGSKKSLPDSAISDLIQGLLKEHVHMKHKFEDEIKLSADKLKALRRKVHEKEQESTTYENLSNKKDQALMALNAKLLSAAEYLKCGKRKYDDLKEKYQAMTEQANTTKKEVDIIKKLIEPETQKAVKLHQMYKKSQEENELLIRKLVLLQKETVDMKDSITNANKFSNEYHKFLSK